VKINVELLLINEKLLNAKEKGKDESL